MFSRMKQRRGSAGWWESNNHVLGSGEIGYDETRNVIKVGDGQAPWGARPLALDSLYMSVEDLTALEARVAALEARTSP